MRGDTRYGSPHGSELLVSIQGWYSRASLLRPEAAALSLPTARRGTATEVMIPELRRVGVVVLG